jgi:hypothetical protein
MASSQEHGGFHESSTEHAAAQAETFEIYERELQARELRIAELERRLAESEGRHRTELAGVNATLSMAEAELVLLRPLHIRREASRSRSRNSSAAAQLQSAVPAPEHSGTEGAVMGEGGPVPMQLLGQEASNPASAHATGTGVVTERRSSGQGTEIQGPVDNIGNPTVEAPTSPITTVAADPTAVAALVSEYGRSHAELKLLAQELIYYKQLAAEAQRAKAEETMAAREAATAAVQACMRRADCEEELRTCRDGIKGLHRQLAALQVEYDDEVRRNFALRSRMQLYAQKMSAVEVEYSLSLCQAEDGSSPDMVTPMKASTAE